MTLLASVLFAYLAFALYRVCDAATEAFDRVHPLHAGSTLLLIATFVAASAGCLIRAVWQLGLAW